LPAACLLLLCLFFPNAAGQLFGVFETSSAMELRTIDELHANTTVIWSAQGFSGGPRMNAQIIDNIYWLSITSASSTAIVVGVNVQTGTAVFKANLPSQFTGLSLFLVTGHQGGQAAIIAACTEPYALQACEIGVLDAQQNYASKVTFPASLTFGGAWVRVNDSLFVAALGNGPSMNLIKVNIPTWTATTLQSIEKGIVISLCHSTATGILSMVSFSNDLRLARFSPSDGTVISSVEVGDETTGSINVVNNACAIDPSVGQGRYYTVGRYRSFILQLLGFRMNGTVATMPRFRGTNPTSLALLPQNQQGVAP